MFFFHISRKQSSFPVKFYNFYLAIFTLVDFSMRSFTRYMLAEGFGLSGIVSILFTGMVSKADRILYDVLLFNTSILVVGVHIILDVLC